MAVSLICTSITPLQVALAARPNAADCIQRLVPVPQVAEDQQWHAFVVDEHGLRDLGRAGQYSIALGINAAGRIVIVTGLAEHSSALLRDGDSVQQLDPFDSGFSQAVAINNHDQVLLKHWSSLQAPTEAYLWERVSLRYLGNFNARALNNSGQVVGSGGAAQARGWVCRTGRPATLAHLAETRRPRTPSTTAGRSWERARLRMGPRMRSSGTVVSWET
jgi:uncharacterized membrane protein